MPLSEHEQKLLEQMEQQLLADDPRFATTMREQRRSGGGGRRRTMIGVVGIVVGLGLVVLSLLNDNSLVLGAAAIAVMFAGLIVALTGPRQRGPVGVVKVDGQTVRGRPAPGRPGPTRSRNNTSGTFMQRLEQRWDRRRDER